MSSNKRLAWQVSDSDGYAKVVFHNHGKAARRIGAERLGYEFEDVKIVRKPEYDQYADRCRVPVSVLLDDGWIFECFGCSAIINNESYSYGLSGMVIEHEESYKLYCNSGCKHAHDERVAAVNKAHAEFKRNVNEARPDLEFYDFSTGWPSLEPYCKFKFHGCEFGGSAKVEAGSNQIAYFIAHGDLDAWHAYEKNRKSGVSLDEK
jgi:hypothetical protein